MKKLMYHDQDNVFDLGVLQANNNMQQKLMLDLMYYFFQTKEEDRKEVLVSTTNGHNGIWIDIS